MKVAVKKKSANVKSIRASEGFNILDVLNLILSCENGLLKVSFEAIFKGQIC